jgi:2-polyprenyl-3-methyl-5-hydroxy-6-metoxy-1,4-benzoquinol methylase
MENINCPLCGADDTRQMFKRKDLRHHISEEDFAVVKCRKCSLVYVNPRPLEEDINDYYPDEFYDPNVNADELLNKLAWQLVIKYKYIKEMKAGKLLDIGCDKGEFMFYMRQRGWQVQGIDFSRKPPNIFGLDIFYGELVDAGYLPESFDLITLWAVLEHVYDPLKMLTYIYSLLKPEGKLILAVTNYNSLPAVFMRHDDIPRHTTLFSKRTLRKMLQVAGFSINGFYFDNNLFGGSNRGVLNYLVKLLAGEKIEDIITQNRTVSRWQEFSSRLRGKPSKLMVKTDRVDIALAKCIDPLLDRLQYGFIMIAKASK